MTSDIKNKIHLFLLDLPREKLIPIVIKYSKDYISEMELAIFEKNTLQKIVFDIHFRLREEDYQEYNTFFKEIIK